MCLVTWTQILCHLRHYTEPVFQVSSNTGTLAATPSRPHHNQAAPGDTAPALSLSLLSTHYPLTPPVLQRYIIRVIFMVPVYAIGSFCSLQWRHGAIYFDTLRDW